ncbi:MAG: hypothetical protein ACRD1A_14415 [Terriglobales bacterium]
MEREAVRGLEQGRGEVGAGGLEVPLEEFGFGEVAAVDGDGGTEALGLLAIGPNVLSLM